jgi:hypothetical protein
MHGVREQHRGRIEFTLTYMAPDSGTNDFKDKSVNEYVLFINLLMPEQESIKNVLEPIWPHTRAQIIFILISSILQHGA